MKPPESIHTELPVRPAPDESRPDQPDVSVVIPYGGGQLALLEIQLAALARQATNLVIEVIVAANTPAAVDELARMRRTSATGAVRSIDASAVAGPSAARNKGWRAARADHVFFCDADDEVPEDWIASLFEALLTSDIAGTPFELCQRAPGLPLKPLTRKVPLVAPFGGAFFPSCSVGFRRRVLFDLDGFDEGLATCEDTDICFRARMAGYSLLGTESIPLRYTVRNSFKEIYFQNVKYGRGDIAFAAKHHLLPRFVSMFYVRFVAELFLLAIASVHPRFRRSFAMNLGLVQGWAVQYLELARSGHLRSSRASPAR